MSGSAVIGSLRTVFGSDFGEFEDGFKKAGGILNGFQANFARTGAALATAAAAMGAAVAASVKNALEEVDGIGKMSTKFNESTESLSKLKYVADAAGASFEGIAEKMREAMTDATSDGAMALKAMGVAAADAAGNVRPMTDVLSDVAEKFSTYENGAAKVALGTKLVGDEVERLLPILNRGAPGIAALTKEAENFGLVISKTTADSAGRFTEVVNKLRAAASGLSLQLAAQLGPIVAQLAEKFFGFVKALNEGTNASGATRLAMESMTLAFKSLASAVVVAGAGFLAFLEAARGMVNFFSAPFSGEWSKDLEKLKSDFAGLTNVLTGTKDILGTIWGDVAAKAADAAQQLQNVNTPVTQSYKDMQAAAKAAFAEIVNSPWEDFATKMAAMKQALADGLITPFEEARMRMRLLTEEWRLQREEARAALETVTSDAWTSSADKLRAIEDAARRGTIAFREMGKMSKLVSDQQRQNWSDLGSTLSTFLTTAFDKSKTAAIAAAFINTAQGITKALAQGGIFGFAQAALIAATGAAQIAKIRSTSIGGGGGGSAVSSPSGGAGMGEGAPAPAASSELFVRGIDAGTLITGDALKDLLTRILQMQRDGYHVVIA